VIPSLWSDSWRERTMMGRLNHDQAQFFYSFRLDEAVPRDHPVREVAGVLDLGWVHSELAPYYPQLGRPSIDPVLMIRMLIVGYVNAAPDVWRRR
jgi:transposase